MQRRRCNTPQQKPTVNCCSCSTVMLVYSPWHELLRHMECLRKYTRWCLCKRWQLCSHSYIDIGQIFVGQLRSPRQFLFGSLQRYRSATIALKATNLARFGRFRAGIFFLRTPFFINVRRFSSTRLFNGVELSVSHLQAAWCKASLSAKSFVASKEP
jgi:hypothetical protein